ncbi:diguanylate cyclase domain-containing protein [Roseibium sp.]|uniref:diguanylate cyclase domain-containing protein n=1 Tax=Roseibium sp. TaxID=1936156 RepID=UPI003A974934
MGSLARYRSGLSGRNGTYASVLAACICLAIGLFVTDRMSKLVEEVLVSKEQQNATARLSAARAQIEGLVAETVALGESVRSYTALNPNLQQAEFAKIAAALKDANSSIIVVGLAPDNILKFIYPLEPNRKAIGLNYRENAQQWPSVAKAINTRSAVVSGPVNLVQGGRALVIRVPVFLPDETEETIGAGPYWGVATLVVEEQQIAEVSGLTELSEKFEIAILSSEDASGNTGVIYGSKDVLDEETVEMPIELMGGASWKLVARPRVGWLPGNQEVWMTRTAGVGISMLFALMAFLIVYEVCKVWGMALHDPMTGLANRRLLEDRMRQLALMASRSGEGFEIFYVDLDGFKPVNDNYGHQVGDQVLICVGNRLQQQIRSSDTLARVGGDEFIVLAAGTMDSEERQQFLRRLEVALAEPLNVAGHEIGMTASIGAASFPSDAKTTDDLIRLADARMYASKKRRSSAARASGEDAVSAQAAASVGFY